MLESNGVSILPPVIAGAALPRRPGSDVAAELGGRPLLRYLTGRHVEAFNNGSRLQHYATPTPYTAEEAVNWLLLPAARTARSHVLLLDPREIAVIQGPLWVAEARGVQYILPDGFPGSAIIVPGAPDAHWAVPVN